MGNFANKAATQATVVLIAMLAVFGAGCGSSGGSSGGSGSSRPQPRNTPPSSESDVAAPDAHGRWGGAASGTASSSGVSPWAEGPLVPTDPEQPGLAGIKPSEARQIVIPLAADLRARASTPTSAASLAQDASRVLKLVRAYRGAPAIAIDGHREPVPGGLISEAPFFGFLVHENTQPIYAKLYESEYGPELAKAQATAPLEAIFDGFMEKIVKNDLDDELRAAGRQVGTCLAQRALDGKAIRKGREREDEKCELDLDEKACQPRDPKVPGSETICPAPSVVSLAVAKLSCRLPAFKTSACKARKLVFAAAKGKLIDARSSHAVKELVRGKFAEIYPQEFPRGFAKGFASEALKAPTTLSAKLRGTRGSLFDAPLIESAITLEGHPDLVGPGVRGLVRLSDFADGLRADLAAAAVLSHAADPVARGEAAALLYASANRLLMLQGGLEATIKAGTYQIGPDYLFDKTKPLRAPSLVSRPFGGWGALRTETAALYWPWDLGGYDPTARVKPTAFRLFPSELVIDERGVPKTEYAERAYETLSDLSDLMSAMNDFINLTGPGGALASHFVPQDELGDKLTNPDSPVFFPVEGRLIAFGVIGAITKNLVTTGVGHLELTDPGGTRGLGLVFHDRVTLQGRDDAPASLAGVAKMLVAASDLRTTLVTDATVPPAMLEAIPQLELALQVGALTLSAQAQNADGGFRARLDSIVESRTARTDDSLRDAILGLRALTRGYDGNRIPLQRLSLRNAWAYLDGFWTGREFTGLDSQLPRSLGWRLLEIWKETQGSVRPDLESEVDWAEWDRRFATLRANLAAVEL